MHPATNSEFCKLVAGREDVDLVRLMLEIATDAYPQLDQVGCLMELDRLGEACRASVSKIPCAQPSERLRTISHILFHVEGFHGNREAYYEPENSYLNQVLQRRTGLPITLGIVYMAVASRAGLRMFGTNTPGHFIVGCQTHGEPIYIDAFDHGEVLTREACDRRIAEIVGHDVVISDEHYRPATPTEITARVLRNMKAAYCRRDNWAPLLQVQRRLVKLLPCQPDERRDLGLIALRAGEPGEALRSLEVYSQLCGGELDSESQISLRLARKIVAELN
jgi:regulator of sirC expression with transglutaminase-like and TPR domain